MKKGLKKIKSYLIPLISFLYILAYGIFTAHAINYKYGDLDNPYPTDFLVPLARVFNAFIIFAGVVFVVVVIYGAIKISMSFGDPRKLEGAKGVLTYAVYGLAVVLVFFIGVALVATAFGIPFLQTFSSPDAIFEWIAQGIEEFLTAAKVFK